MDDCNKAFEINAFSMKKRILSCIEPGALLTKPNADSFAE